MLNFSSLELDAISFVLFPQALEQSLDITCLRVDMNFIFECSTQYRMSERSLFYKQTNNNVFDDSEKSLLSFTSEDTKFTHESLPAWYFTSYIEIGLLLETA